MFPVLNFRFIDLQFSRFPAELYDLVNFDQRFRYRSGPVIKPL